MSEIFGKYFEIFGNSCGRSFLNNNMMEILNEIKRKILKYLAERKIRKIIKKNSVPIKI